MKTIKQYSLFVVTDRGFHRENNEDNFVMSRKMNYNFLDNILENDSKRASKKWNVVGVFDGMGGVAQGEEASLIVGQEIQKLEEMLCKKRKEKIDEMVFETFAIINERILNETNGAGSTASILVFNKKMSKVFHIGDSRVYWIRDGMIDQLTHDHTLENYKKQHGFGGSVTENDKHSLLRYLGMDDFVASENVDSTEWIENEKMDCFFLCSDGLYENIERIDILKCCEQDSIHEDMFKGIIQEKKGKDNWTYLVLKFM